MERKNWSYLELETNGLSPVISKYNDETKKKIVDIFFTSHEYKCSTEEDQMSIKVCIRCMAQLKLFPDCFECYWDYVSDDGVDKKVFDAKLTIWKLN